MRSVKIVIKTKIEKFGHVEKIQESKGVENILFIASKFNYEGLGYM